MNGGARIPQDKIDEVRLAADIVEVVGARVQLKRKGKDYWGLCPFHGDSDPSLKVDRGRGSWHCFGCNEGGSVFNFIMKDEGLSFPEAVRELARRYGVQLPRPKLNPAQRREMQKRQRLLQVLEIAGKFFVQQLQTAGGSAAREYLIRQRGLDADTVRDFGLGFAPDAWEALRGHLLSQNIPEELAVEAGLLVPRDRGSGSYDRFRGRVMLPIRGPGASLVSFGGRILGPGEPKYLNGPESPVFRKSQTLYNLDRARAHMRRKDRALVVEGYFDVITLAAGGFGETVAPLGTALTAQQVRRLKGQGSEVILVFDGDQAGLRAAMRSLPIFLAEGVNARVLLLPPDEDPDTFLRSQGAEALEQALGRARPLVETALDRVRAEGDNATPEGRSAIVGRAAEVITAIRDPLVRNEYLNRFAAQMGLSVNETAKRMGLPLVSGRPISLVQAPARGQGLLFQEERSLLELALGSPHAARTLARGGALEAMGDQRLAAVARALQEVLDRGAEPTPAAVSQALEDQSLAGLVSELGCRRLDDDQAPRIAQAHLDQLARRRARRLREESRRALAAAQAAGDMAQVARLQAQRKRLTTFTPSSKAEKD